MAIYNENGVQIFSAFGADGLEKESAYNAEGTQVFYKSRTLKVMTYNVGTWYAGEHDNVPADKDAEYYALQKGIIESNDADIVFIEEYCKQFSKAGRTAISILQECGYPYIHEQGGDNPQASSANGRCVASKYPISNYTARNFNDGSGTYYDSCVVSVNGIQINLVITHLHWNDRDKRASEIALIMSLLNGYTRFILAGDFNTTDCYDTSGADYTAVIKQLVDAGYNLANCADFGFILTYYNTPVSEWTGVLDNIVSSSNIRILDVEVDDTKLYDELPERVDHIPLIATLEL